ncbi:glycosyl hydrolase 115 family protein [Pelagicoccus sp. SDUM812005]|uniref:glycosyl hydrolase 115 family protein n=1 Tax=Pelagicoccus sp. SDUM812005 TaxID=3041257 RepID=UPI00280D6099|nr:glycosyl hydrolase 115 family protein [Pelagicoccus sp. SDUM812005]MDQ8182612.1 glycosyl hydrolase 115 family protein [Pelagicoccus sp. SDUM812005]
MKRLSTLILPALLVPFAHAAPLPIVNGGFEIGSDGTSSKAPISGWTDGGASSGFWLQDGSGGGSFPQDPNEPQAGELYLSGNRLAGGAGSQPSSSSLSQVVAIDSADLPLVAEGKAALSLSFYYHDTDDNDSAVVDVEFLDATSESLGTASSGGLGNVASNGTSYNSTTAPWTEVLIEENLPVGTHSIRIVISTNRVGGSATNVHFDSFSGEVVTASGYLPIVNGDFETGDDGTSSKSPIAGWSDDGGSAGFWLQDGLDGGSFPQDPSEPQGGSLYLTANRLAGGAGSQPSDSTLSQTVAVNPRILGLIQAGEAAINLSFYYQDTDQNDASSISIEFLDAALELIGSDSTGELVNVANNGTAYDPSSAPWTFVELKALLPAATESVRISISTSRSGGSATNVHFDSFVGWIVRADDLGPLEDAESAYRSANPWVAYDGATPPAIPGGEYFTIPFMGVSETVSAGSLMIAGNGQAATIHYSDTDAAVVGIAAEALADDIERVTGIAAAVSTAAPSASEVILLGTVGSSPLIDSLVSDGKIDVSAIQGKWEAYTAAVVENPLQGVSRALVIAGSDRRGTAFGVFALSESMGVSPWYFWGDVPTAQKSALYIAGSHTQPSPGVKYRGIFLNDEDWGLQPWAANTFEPEVGNIGPKTYSTIYELLLRLHSNVIWPAMHEYPVMTTPFYEVPGNMEAADDYAIVISTSHHEPMLRNSHEYNESERGSYNYWSNRSNIYDFWEERVIETADTEAIYTIGMRGRTDAGMLAPAGTTDAQKAQKIQDEIIPDQRQMISDYVNKNAAEMPQIFIPYKETLVQYQSGLELPDDVTILWPDDNHGYIRQLSTTQEQARSGGSGVYYHLSYWGVPTSYLWLCTTPPGMTRSEMIKAWDFEAKNMWLVNVGDLKPHEIGTDFFLRMARNPEAFREFDQRAYLSQWAARVFGSTHADAIADVLEDYYHLNIVKRPEHLNRNDSGFSHTENGDEAGRRLEDFSALAEAAEEIYSQLPAEDKAAFYAMVLYPVKGSNFVNRRVLLAERSRLWASQGRAGTAELAAAAEAAHAALLAETEFYNKTNADGKWDYMLNPMDISQLPGWAQETQNAFIMPSTGSYTPAAEAGLGVAIEGEESPLEEGIAGELPKIARHADVERFVDVYNKGAGSFAWTATASAPWIKLSQTSGDADARIMVGVDWTQAPRGYAIPGQITIAGAGETRTVNVRAFYPQGLDLGTLPAAVEADAKVVIEAEDYTARRDDSDGIAWTRVDGATASRDGMTILPVTAASLDPENLPADAASLTYEFFAFSTGQVEIRTECLPTHRITADHAGLRYAISLNGGPVQVTDVNAAEYSAAWNANTLRAASYGISKHEIAQAGLQTIQIWMVDAGVVLDRLVVDFDSSLFEAESLSVQDTNTSVIQFTDGPASGGGGLHMQSTAVGQYASFAVPSLAAGDYQLSMRTKKWGSRGIVQLAIAENPEGPFTDVGDEIDLYSSSGVYENIDPLAVHFDSSGTKYVRITVVGKNVAASNYWVLLDLIEFEPVLMVSDQPIRNWRMAYFGTFEAIGEASDSADPDADGIVNLMEYATGSYPTLSSQPPFTENYADGRLHMSFNRVKAATDIVYRVLAGSDLPLLSPIWSSEDNAYPQTESPMVEESVTDSETVLDAERRFMRLEVELL